MVFGWLYIEKKRWEARALGRADGIEEANTAWQGWNQRRPEAEANRQSFTEPPPDLNAGPNEPIR